MQATLSLKTGGIKVDKVLEYCVRGIIQHLNGDYGQFNEYKNKAIGIYKEVKFEESCIYPVSDMVPEEVYRNLREITIQ